MRGVHLGSRLSLSIFGNAFMRIASGASAVLVGLYLADLADRGFRVNVALVGTLGAVSFASELAAGVPMGVASDAFAPRALMTAGALFGAVATQLFGITSQPRVFFLSRTIEGLGAASVTPSLLAHLTDATDRSHPLRARVMSYFELSLLAGLALGGVVGAQFWRRLGTVRFRPLPRFISRLEECFSGARPAAAATAERRPFKGFVAPFVSPRCCAWLQLGSA